MLNLDEIEARANAATPGPWRLYTEKYRGVVAPNGPDPRGDSAYYGAQLVAESCTREDEAFIAHARQDVVELCAEVRRLNHVILTNAKLCGVHGLCCEEHGRPTAFRSCECTCHEAAEAQLKSTAGAAGNRTPNMEVTHGAPAERPELGEGKEAERAEPGSCTSAGRAEGSRPPPRAPGSEDADETVVGRVETRWRSAPPKVAPCVPATGGRRCATHLGLPLAIDDCCVEGRGR